jgi:hypothetical protein
VSTFLLGAKAEQKAHETAASRSHKGPNHDLDLTGCAVYTVDDTLSHLYACAERIQAAAEAEREFARRALRRCTHKATITA